MTRGNIVASSGDGAGIEEDKLTVPSFTVEKGGGPQELEARRAPSIGSILVEAGRLSIEDAERVLRLQRERGLRFGEAAKALGVLQQIDIEFALSRQFDYPYLRAGESCVSERVVVAYEPLRAEVEALRSLRAQLMVRWFGDDPARRALAIISAARGEGRSFLTSNLAVLFAQLGERTLLIDADLRNPTQHTLFSVDNGVGLSALLVGRATPAEAIKRVPGLLNLSVLPGGTQPPNPQELLAGRRFSELLNQMAGHFDVVLLDSPPAGETADAQSIVLGAGAALIVARKHAARSWRVQGVSDSLAQAKATIVGAVLNDF